MSHEVRVLAPAKINLYLGVGEVLPSGYHAVTSVMHAIDLVDELTVTPARRLSLECETDLGVLPQDNLVWRAAVTFGELLGRTPTFGIRIIKRIPHRAGLGGGSSDAAATIAGIARLWGIDALDERCLHVARSLGADVPFFLYGGASLMGGRGDELVRRLPALDAPVLLVRPPQPVSTAEAYRVFDAAPVPALGEFATVHALDTGDSEVLARSLANNLQPASVAVVPDVGEALAWVRAQVGVLGAEVAGSGSAVFALTDSALRAGELADAAMACGWWSAATKLRHQGVTVTEEGSE